MTYEERMNFEKEKLIKFMKSSNESLLYDAKVLIELSSSLLLKQTDEERELFVREIHESSKRITEYSKKIEQLKLSYVCCCEKFFERTDYSDHFENVEMQTCKRCGITIQMKRNDNTDFTLGYWDKKFIENKED